MAPMTSLLDTLYGISGNILTVVASVIKVLLPLLSVVILVRCGKSMLCGKPEAEIWGYLSLPNGSRIDLDHWENVIGRSKASDAVLEYPTLSRSHAAIIRDDKGAWMLYDLRSKGGITLNGKKLTEPAGIKNGDLISFAGVDTVFVATSLREEQEQAMSRTMPGREIRPGGTLGFLTEFQILLAVQLCIYSLDKLNPSVLICFGALSVTMWVWYLINRSMKRRGFEVETLAFYLTTIGFAIVASKDPGSLYKYAVLLMAGIFLYIFLGCFLRDLNLAKRTRWPIAAAGIALLALNLVIAKVTNGAKNWVSIGGFSLQPSEFVKICFVFAGAATLDRLFARRNLLLFIAFSGVCVGALVLMSDFGTAVVFFVTYLVIAYIRSGDIATVFLSAGGAVIAGVIAVAMKPYIADRFATWGHAWESVNDSGYQQVRAMCAAASGGLFGAGAGNGWLKNVFAADTDMVFGMVCEELGLIVALCMIAAVVVMAVFVVKSAKTARSSFYVIGSCAAVTILLVQIMLNVFGSLDIIPFTGVTFPFVSRGGSSLMSCWGLMAFIKAADTRQNASFAIRLPKRSEDIAEGQVMDDEED